MRGLESECLRKIMIRSMLRCWTFVSLVCCGTLLVPEQYPTIQAASSITQTMAMPLMLVLVVTTDLA